MGQTGRPPDAGGSDRANTTAAARPGGGRWDREGRRAPPWRRGRTPPRSGPAHTAHLTVPHRATPSCRAVPCRAVPCRAESCCAVPCRAVPCRAVPCRAESCRAVPCRAVPPWEAVHVPRGVWPLARGQESLRGSPSGRRDIQPSTVGLSGLPRPVRLSWTGATAYSSPPGVGYWGPV